VSRDVNYAPRTFRSLGFAELYTPKQAFIRMGESGRETMTRLSVDALEKALVRLEEGFAEAACYPQLLTVRDGVIQRFEIAMDLSWKLLQRALKDIYQVDEGAVLSKRDIFRQAAKHRLLEDTETWFGHYEARNQTSHIYDSEEAARVFERARAFLADAKITLERLRNAA